jgi:hypothetical protein
MSNDTATQDFNGSPSGRTPRAVSTASSLRHPARLAFLRAIIWGLIGLIYAPLFIGLVAVFGFLGSGPWIYAGAAATAGGAGAALYSGRDVALLGAGAGVGVGVLTLLVVPDLLRFEHIALIAAVIAVVISLQPAFPVRCDRKVPVKMLLGVATGALCGVALGIAEPLHPRPFSTFALLAFLVSVNGILYVASVAWLLPVVRGTRPPVVPCNWVEALVAGSLAALAAGSVWMMAGPFMRHQSPLVQSVSDAIYNQLPMALLGGIVGGAIAGALLATFRFPWVHES